MKKAFRCVTKYCAHPKLVKDLHWSLNPNILPDLHDYQTGSLQSTHNNDQITCNMSSPVAKRLTKDHILEQINCNLDLEPLETPHTTTTSILRSP